MRTHCKEGHDLAGKKKCRVCMREAQRRWEAKRFNDGLTPQERLKRARRKWS